MVSNPSTGDDPDNDKDVPPKKEPAPTPLISVAEVPLSAHPVVHISENRRYVIKEHAADIADTWEGSVKNHQLGKLGEDACTKFFGVPDRLNLEVIPDGGDDGYDLRFNGTAIDVKTVSRRHAEQPKLCVNVYEPLTADYYVLVSRIGPGDFRLVGYAPRAFVANARKEIIGQESYHIVDQEYLFPFLGGGEYLQVHSVS